ncbi:cupredoxin domain-containing protein [Paenibacillus daejeonensis]|uniref:cupredoxin domain-containing protein n=1 Tax=Paenibacillus daejeonensis TaxID=135193 RepID=UPI00036D7A3F|nr:cupredoxin domain-containing protein [Paenibacillus daejeonensis]
MKKQLSVAVTAFALAIMLAACGGGNGADTNNTPANTPANSETGASNDAAAQEVVIEATNWEFDQSEYRVKQGEPVNITLKSTQGNHGISINNTDVKLKKDESMNYTFDAPGEYQIVCNIPCGTGHTKMVSTLIVE